MSQFSATADKMDVGYVARLARIRLSDSERASLQEQLDHILAYVDQLKELNVDGVEPTAHALPLENVFREDVPTSGISTAAAMANAPRPRDNQFLVPRIVE